MNICLFSKDEIEKPLDKKDERAQHILKILHKKEGDFFYAGIIDGKAGNAQITEITDSFIKYTFIPQSDGKPLFPLIMIIGFPRPIQLKRLLRDIAALGVKEVHLTATELGEKSYMQSNLVEHGSAYKMLLDGTVQAASTQVPKLFLHRNFEECIKTVKKSIPENSIKLCLDNVFPQGSLSQTFKKDLRCGKRQRTRLDRQRENIFKGKRFHSLRNGKQNYENRNRRNSKRFYNQRKCRLDGLKLLQSDGISFCASQLYL